MQVYKILDVLTLYYYIVCKSTKYWTFMPYKDPAVRAQKQKEYSKKHYEKNKSTIKANSANTKRSIRAQFREFKSSLSCTICGENHPATLDFHHHTPHKDNIKISKLLVDGRIALAMREIKEKCVVLCANCHRKHHYEEQKKKPAEAGL